MNKRSSESFVRRNVQGVSDPLAGRRCIASPRGGYFHIDIAEVRTEEGKLSMLVAVDRTSKLAFAELHERITRRDAGNRLRRLIDTVPYTIHTVLTDLKGDSWTAAEVRQLIAQKARFRCHGFVLACAENDIDHRLTKPNHPWISGQVERMNRTIKHATVRRHHHESHERLRQHLAIFLHAYNFAKRLKTLKGLTVFEFINEKWTAQPERFRLHPNNLILGSKR